MLKLVSTALFALSFAGAAVAEDTVIWESNVQGWNVVVDRTIENSCFIVSGFENDTLLRFQFNATQRNLQFIVASLNWEDLRNGEQYDLQVAFGGREPWEGLAEAHRWNDILPSLILSVPAAGRQASDFMSEFIDSGSVRISHAGAEIAHLMLSGTDEAVGVMLDCQASMSQARPEAGTSAAPLAWNSDNDPV